MAGPTLFEEALALLRGRGVELTTAPGEYVVNWPKGGRETEFRTGDLAEAVAHALVMGEAPHIPAPLGPTGTLRGRIYAHNRKLAARRQQKS